VNLKTAVYGAMTTLLATLLAIWVVTPVEGHPCLLLVVGAGGQSEYEAQFSQWADRWRAAAASAQVDVIKIGRGRESGIHASDRDRLRAVLSEQASVRLEPLWIVLIGHGTYDRREAKFNLRGPDVTDAELSEWLVPIKRPVAVINCASASGSFINRLSGENRVIITATRSGDEQNFARFGRFMAEAIVDPRTDLDQDGQVSLLEAYLRASSRVAESYREQSQLATEHALLDDNGDGLGTPADWFRGTHATRRAKDGAPLDGARAAQFCLVPSTRERDMPRDLRLRRDEIELSIAALRDQKEKLGEETYYSRLDPLLVELARLYRQARLITPARADGNH
jgi:hypothetical protein